MCFKCGAISHPGVSCSSVGNFELQEYMASHDVHKCPHCGYATEKIEGCNHMTCSRCNKEWCWVCKAKMPNNWWGEMHFEGYNLFGCPGV